MDLTEFTSGTKDTKPWLTIVAKSLTAETVTADNFVGPIIGNEVTLNEQASVPDPAPGKLTLFANLSGQVSTTNSVGDTITLLDNPSSQDENMNGHNLTSVGVLSGSVNSRNANDIVSNTGTSVIGNLPSFSGTSGKGIQDSGIPASSVSGGPFLPLAGGTMAGDIAMGANSVTNVLILSGASNSRLADDIVSNSAPVSSTSNIAVFSDGTGLHIQDSHKNIANAVFNTTTAVDGNLASFNGPSGVAIHDSGVPAAVVSRSIYSLSVPNPITLSNFTSLASVLTGAVALGSLTFPPNSTQAGTVLRFSAFLQLHIKNGSSITFALVSGIPFGPSVSNTSGSDQGPTGITWTGEMVIIAGGFALLNSFYGTSWDGSTFVSNGGPAGGFWANDFSGTNSIDLQVGFSVADPGNSVSCASFSVMQLF